MFNLLDSTNQVPLFFAREAAQVIAGVLLLHYAFTLFRKKEHVQKHVSKICVEIERGKEALRGVMEGMPDIRFAMIGIPANGDLDFWAGFNACDKTFRNKLLGKFIDSLDVAGEMRRQSACGQAIWAIKNESLEGAVRKSSAEKVGYIGKLVWFFDGLTHSDRGTPALALEWDDLREQGEEINRNWQGLFELLDEAGRQEVDRKTFTERLKKYYSDCQMRWDVEWGRGL